MLVATAYSDIELVIDADYDNYTEEDQKKMLKAVASLLEIKDSEVRIKKIRRGSVKMVLRLTTEQAERLLWASKAGALEDFGVTEATLLEEPNQTLKVTPDFSHSLEDREQFRSILKQLDSAVSLATEALGRTSANLNSFSTALLDLLIKLEERGDFARQMGDVDDAKSNYLKALELFPKSKNYLEVRGRLHANLAVLYDQVGDSNEAIRYYQQAIDLFRKLNPPANLDIAELNNNLAFLYEEQDDFDQAENLFLNALEIVHDELGREDAETAAICNNLGALYQKKGHHAQAQEMHRMALAARQVVLGEAHPDTSQSHCNLAVTLADDGQMNEAREHFEKSISIYEKHRPEYEDYYETAMSNYISFLESVQDYKTAAIVKKRLSKKLKGE